MFTFSFLFDSGGVSIFSWKSTLNSRELLLLWDFYNSCLCLCFIGLTSSSWRLESVMGFLASAHRMRRQLVRWPLERSLSFVAIGQNMPDDGVISSLNWCKPILKARRDTNPMCEKYESLWIPLASYFLYKDGFTQVQGCNYPSTDIPLQE
jgi:hypothetical protein